LRAVISGYYGFHNIGDEAVLYSMLQALRERDPGLQPVVLSAEPQFTAQTYGVESVNRWKPGEVAKALRKADILISGGGSLLQDVTGPKSLLYYLGVIWLARMLGKPVVFYAQGIGPINSNPGRKMVSFTANGVKAITVRDEDSRADLLDMGVKKDITVTADPVLGLDPDQVPGPAGRDILSESGVSPEDGPLAGVSVRPWHGEQWQAELAGACDGLVKRGMQVVFLPMQHPGDLQVSEAVSGLMRRESFIVRRTCSVPEMLSVISGLDLLVGMRLHSLIMAAVLGVPPVGIAYDPKIKRFLARVGLEPGGSPEDLNSVQLLAGVDRARTLERQELLQRVQPLRQQALESVQFVVNPLTHA